MQKGLLVGTIAATGLWAWIRHLQLPVGPSRMHWGAQVFGHRGCRNIPNVPENTLEAFAFAKDHGATGIELDVRLSKDEVLVVYHDAFLGTHVKDAASQRRVDDLTVAEIKMLNFAADPTNSVRIPTLEECILYCKENKLKMLIELKELKQVDVCATKLVELFQRYPEYLYSETTVIAFSPFALYAVRKKDRSIAVGQLFSGESIQHVVKNKIEAYPKFYEYCPSLLDFFLTILQTRIAPWFVGTTMICPKYTLFKESFKKKWHRRNICVYVWGFSEPEECAPIMRVEGVLVACDDRHEEFAPTKRPPNFDIFGDEERKEEVRRKLTK